MAPICRSVPRQPFPDSFLPPAAPPEAPALPEAGPAARLGGLLGTVPCPRASCPRLGLAQLSGTLHGLAQPAGVEIRYTAGGVPHAVRTDDGGAYRIALHPCDHAVIAAPEIPGYTAMPLAYALSPVCGNRTRLDFAFAPQAAG